MALNSGDSDCTIGLSGRLLTRWTSDVRAGLASPLTGASLNALKALCYSVGLAVVEEVVAGGGGVDLTGYETSAHAAATYATLGGLAGYLTAASAAATYETQSAHAADVATLETSSHAAATYETLSDAALKETAAHAAATYVPLTGETTLPNAGLHIQHPNGFTHPAVQVENASNIGSGTPTLRMLVGGGGNYQGYMKFLFSDAGNENNWCMALCPGSPSDDFAPNAGTVWCKSTITSPNYAAPIDGLGVSSVVWSTYAWSQDGYNIVRANFNSITNLACGHPYGIHGARVWIAAGTVPSDSGHDGFFEIWRSETIKSLFRLSARNGNAVLGEDQPAPTSTSPKLKVMGDVEASGTSKGFILTSPGGTRYRIKVADDGTLSTEAA